MKPSASAANDRVESAAVEASIRNPEARISDSDESSREAQLAARMAELDGLLEAGNEEDALQLLKRLAVTSGGSTSGDADGESESSPLLLGFGKGSLVGRSLSTISE